MNPDSRQPLRRFARHDRPQLVRRIERLSADPQRCRRAVPTRDLHQRAILFTVERAGAIRLREIPHLLEIAIDRQHILRGVALPSRHISRDRSTRSAERILERVVIISLRRLLHDAQRG
ncbi:MAG: hypothetical protein JWO97_1685 [Acidobacteria bacterium]|nr:hypothetical protein [Acidobacteriota bacterium]